MECPQRRFPRFLETLACNVAHGVIFKTFEGFGVQRGPRFKFPRSFEEFCLQRGPRCEFQDLLKEIGLQRGPRS